MALAVTGTRQQGIPKLWVGVQMIIEHEFLEQVLETSEEWSLSRSGGFIGRNKNPWPVLRAMHEGKCLTLVDRSGRSLPGWKTEEIFRNCDASVGTDVIVKVTEAGAKRVG